MFDDMTKMMREEIFTQDNWDDSVSIVELISSKLEGYPNSLLIVVFSRFLAAVSENDPKILSGIISAIALGSMTILDSNKVPEDKIN